MLNRPKTLLVKYFVPKKFGLSAKRVALENGIILWQDWVKPTQEYRVLNIFF
jgi:hypothetical protein